MEKSKIIGYSFLHALGITAYISLVVLLLQWTSSMNLGDSQTMIVPIFMLLVLVFSVGVMAVAVFARPVFLFVGGFKKEALEFVVYTLLWVLIILAIVGIIILLMPSQTPVLPKDVRF